MQALSADLKKRTGKRICRALLKLMTLLALEEGVSLGLSLKGMQIFIGG